jgi:hypothetical protein
MCFYNHNSSACLHDYIIKMDGPHINFEQEGDDGEEDEEPAIFSHPNAPLGMSYLPVVSNEDWEAFEGMSYALLAIVEHVHAHCIMWPTNNLECR